MPDPQSSAILILATAATRDEAERIAEALVAERLAGCVQLSPIESWYRWEDRIAHAPETRLHIKTVSNLAQQVEQRVRALHSYDLPEVVMVPITGGSAAYLDWIEDAVRPDRE